MYKFSVFAAYSLEEIGETKYDSIGSNDLTSLNNEGRRPGKHHYATNFVRDGYKETRLQTDDISTNTFTCWTWFKADTNVCDAVLLARGQLGKPVWAIKILAGYIAFEVGDAVSFSNSLLGPKVSNDEHFVCISHNNDTGDRVLYYDGAIVAQGQSPIIMPTTPKEVALGGYVDGGIAFDGWQDSILFTQLVLDVADMDWIYNAGAGRDIIEFFDLTHIGSLCVIKRDKILLAERETTPLMERENIPVIEVKHGRR